MKKVSFILAGLVLLGLVYSYGIAKGEKNDFSGSMASEDYIIIRYNPYGGSRGGKDYVFVHFGGDKTEKIQLTKEQTMGPGTTNFIIDLLNKYSDQGYTLISTTIFSTGEGIGLITENTCFLKRAK